MMFSFGMLPLDLVALICTAILGLISFYFGAGYTCLKKKLRALSALLASVSAAIEDDKITVDELKELQEKVEVLLSSC